MFQKKEAKLREISIDFMPKYNCFSLTVDFDNMSVNVCDKGKEITEDAIDYKEQFRLYDLLGYISLGVAGAGAGVSFLSFSNIPSLDNLNSEFTSFDEEIQLLEGVLQ